MDWSWINGVESPCLRNCINILKKSELIPCSFDEASHILILTEWFNEPHLEIIQKRNIHERGLTYFERTGIRCLQGFALNPERVTFLNFSACYSWLTYYMHRICESKELDPYVELIRRNTDIIVKPEYIKESIVNRMTALRANAWGMVFTDQGETLYKKPDGTWFITRNNDFYPAYAVVTGFTRFVKKIVNGEEVLKVELNDFGKMMKEKEKKWGKENERREKFKMRTQGKLPKGHYRYDIDLLFYTNTFCAAYFLRKYDVDICIKKDVLKFNHEVRPSVRDSVIVGCNWVRKLMGMRRLTCQQPKKTKTNMRKDITSYHSFFNTLPDYMRVETLNVADWVINENGSFQQTSFPSKDISIGNDFEIYRKGDLFTIKKVSKKDYRNVKFSDKYEEIKYMCPGREYKANFENVDIDLDLMKTMAEDIKLCMLVREYAFKKSRKMFNKKKGKIWDISPGRKLYYQTFSIPLIHKKMWYGVVMDTPVFSKMSECDRKSTRRMIMELVTKLNPVKRIKDIPYQILRDLKRNNKFKLNRIISDTTVLEHERVVQEYFGKIEAKNNFIKAFDYMEENYKRLYEVKMFDIQLAIDVERIKKNPPKRKGSKKTKKYGPRIDPEGGYKPAGTLLANRQETKENFIKLLKSTSTRFVDDGFEDVDSDSSE